MPHHHAHLSRIHYAVLLLSLSCAGAAQAQSKSQAPPLATTTLKEVVISGSRTEQNADELPLSMEVLRSKDLEERNIRDIRDVAEGLPNVSVSRSPARFTLGRGNAGRDQNAGFNVRGLDGNRVLMLVDGVRQPRSYVFAANSFGRDYVDTGLLQRIEVVKGPVSVLYGSDGIGGLVNFITQEPEAFLRDGKTFGGTASAGYSGDNQGVRLGTTIAGRLNTETEWLLGVNASHGKGLKNKGTNSEPNENRTEANPESSDTRALLGKLVWQPGGGHKHVLTFEHVDKRTSYDLLSAITRPPVTARSTLGSTARTEMRRNRFTVDSNLPIQAAWADSLRTVVSYQDSHSLENAYEKRNRLPDRVRDVTYDERTWQANAQAHKTWGEASGMAHKLTYGIDYVTTKVNNLQTGITPAAGEKFPLKRFPDTKESSAALYAQNEILLGAWSITPGVRYEHFKLQADQAGFSPPSSVPAASITDSAVSPKLGALYQATPQWAVFGNYATGFKAPNAGQINGYFENIANFYASIPNPNLKAESSQNIEFGVRGRLDALSIDAAIFTGRYKDFIEDQVQVRGSGTASDPMIFQSINKGRVSISGFEIKGNMDWGVVGTGRLSTPFAYGYVKGRDTETSQPLNSIDPQRLHVGMRYSTSAWMTMLEVNYRSAKKAGDVDETQLASQFLTPSSTTLNLRGQWHLRKNLRLQAGVYNLTDRKTWNWSDVRGLSSASRVADAYSQPGRYVRLGLVADF